MVSTLNLELYTIFCFLVIANHNKFKIRYRTSFQSSCLLAIVSKFLAGLVVIILLIQVMHQWKDHQVQSCFFVQVWKRSSNWTYVCLLLLAINSLRFFSKLEIRHLLKRWFVSQFRYEVFFYSFGRSFCSRVSSNLISSLTTLSHLFLKPVSNVFCSFSYSFFFSMSFFSSTI